MSNFHPLKVVDHGKETPLHVDEKLNKLTFRVKDFIGSPSTTPA